MTRETIREELLEAIQVLFRMAHDAAYNNFSDSLAFIIRTVDPNSRSRLTINESRKIRKEINDSKPLLSLNQAVHKISECFDSIFEINLYIYKAQRDKTIVEVELTELDHRLPIIVDIPQVHCKINIPPYADNLLNREIKKFDINWEHGLLKSRWKMFWWRIKTMRKIKIAKLKENT